MSRTALLPCNELSNPNYSIEWKCSLFMQRQSVRYADTSSITVSLLALPFYSPFVRQHQIVLSAKTYTGSSLVRHLRNNCNKKQPQRRKSCNQCIATKSKCNLTRPTCLRCSLRQIPCAYTGSRVGQPEQPASPGITSASLNFDLNTMPTFQPQNPSATFDSTVFDPFFADLGPWSPSQLSELAVQAPQHMGLGLLPFNDSISCATPGIADSESESGSNQRLGLSSDSNSIALANHSMELIFRVFRTWPQMLADGFQIPPIFHSTHLPSQMKLPQPLATCITLVKMWHGQCPGAEEIVRVTIRQELDLVVDRVCAL